MAWSNSKVFRPFLGDALDNAQAFDLGAGGNTIKVALYDNDITPDNDVTGVNSAYNVGVWVSTGNEVFQAGTWPQGGQTLANQRLDTGTADTVFFAGDNTASGSNATLTNAYGVLVYASTVSNRGICYNYLGGANSVTNGVLTIIWHSNGIFRITL